MEEANTEHFPYEFWEFTPEEKVEYKKAFPYPLAEYVRVGPKGFVVCRPYKKIAASIYNMPLRSSDIVVATYQRSGTTWTQELVWLIANDFDYETAAKIPLTQRYPFIDLCMFTDETRLDSFAEYMHAKYDVNALKLKEILLMLKEPATTKLASAPSPRFIKTHLSMSLLPPKILDTAKVVYVARDPRDVVVSSYHHARLFRSSGLEVQDFKQFWDLFRKNLFQLTPYFEHVKEAWVKRDEPNMLFVFYEDMLKDLPSTVRRVASFLGKQVNAVQMEILCDHLSITKFKHNKSVNFDELSDTGIMAPNEEFIRKGKSGGWRDYFDEEMTQQAEQWIRDNLSDTDLRFPTINLMKLS